ncbi:hypothetical protein J6590_068830 [Homalodisca vitripennis]|nr:hypothetical protein J6590_068830 [Homalodisca vitripennis]
MPQVILLWGCENVISVCPTVRIISRNLTDLDTLKFVSIGNNEFDDGALLSMGFSWALANIHWSYADRHEVSQMTVEVCVLVVEGKAIMTRQYYSLNNELLQFEAMHCWEQRPLVTADHHDVSQTTAEIAALVVAGNAILT